MSEQFVFNESETSNYSYYSSKYSPINGRDIFQTAEWKKEELPEVVAEEWKLYRNMTLDADTHFYDISVNTTHSSVHVPTNVYDKSKTLCRTNSNSLPPFFFVFIGPTVMEALQWSEALDEVFVQNYNSDPALSWQYFGSDTGIMRHYPGKYICD